MQLWNYTSASSANWLTLIITGLNSKIVWYCFAYCRVFNCIMRSYKFSIGILIISVDKVTLYTLYEWLKTSASSVHCLTCNITINYPSTSSAHCKITLVPRVHTTLNTHYNYTSASCAHCLICNTTIKYTSVSSTHYKTKLVPRVHITF